ncbi:PHYTOCHROME KINASE SUBSTRATE 4 [Spatholobus suberectus]|nr:PHYTOCHROME KINASE SUBSTRATE 4 [Spatholobus suberectus]
MERAIHPNLNPKPPTFSPHLTPDQPNKCEPHRAMRPSGPRVLDHDSTSELSTFDAHKYFNQVTDNDNIQKVMTINSNSRVSPLHNMDTEHKHNPEQGDITNSTRSFSYSASSSVGGNGNHNMINNYKAHSFHAATPTPPPSSSKSTLNNKAGLLFHHPKTSTISVNPPQTSSNLSKKLRTSLSKPIWLLRRKCPCNDKKSVQVKGHTNTPKPKKTPPQSLSHNRIHKDSLNHKTSTTTSNKEVKPQRLFQFQPAMNQVRRPSSEAFTFPLILARNSNNPTKPHQVLLNVVHEEEDTTPRESLHVFQPPSPPNSRAMDDDAASDASSDLFEIESFSTQTTTLPYPIITPPIAQCHETTDHEFFFAADAGSSLWRQRRLRDTEVLPPL